MNKTVALVFVAGTLFLAGCCTPYRAKRWEYKTLFNPSDGQLNELAAQGWRVESFDAVQTVNKPDWCFLLTRPKQ
jgi:hypothetical protein